MLLEILKSGIFYILISEQSAKKLTTEIMYISIGSSIFLYIYISEKMTYYKVYSVTINEKIDRKD